VCAGRRRPVALLAAVWSCPPGDRRIVSVLVADVGSSTTIAEELGPERSKFLFDEVVRLMNDEVDRFGGTVAQLTGDGLLALFGAPTAHEDHPARAVRSALALRRRCLPTDERSRTPTASRCTRGSRSIPGWS
jgi:class 3 adenylate cyclase